MKYYKKLYGNKSDNQDKMDKLLGRHQQPNHTEEVNLN